MAGSITEPRSARKARRGKTEPSTFELSLLTCECGAQILLVPDLKAMSHAIEAHIEEHRKNSGNSQVDDAELERLEENLIAQVLLKVAAIRLASEENSA